MKLMYYNSCSNQDQYGHYFTTKCPFEVRIETATELQVYIGGFLCHCCQHFIADNRLAVICMYGETNESNLL